jgi:hypothetical protein
LCCFIRDGVTGYSASGLPWIHIWNIEIQGFKCGGHQNEKGIRNGLVILVHIQSMRQLPESFFSGLFIPEVDNTGAL